MASETRQRLIDSAIRRFYRSGFRNVGIDEILDDVGISKTAFYKHFDSKDDLMLAALETQNQWLQNTFRAMIERRGGESAIGGLWAIFDVVESILASDQFQGCIFVNAAMEFPLMHDPAHVAAAGNKRAVEEIVHDLAARAGAADPWEMAREVCLVLEGTYVTRQVTGETRAVQVAKRLMGRIIAAHIPTATGG